MIVLLIALLVPYFAWGIYAMQLRFVRHHEWPVSIEAATLGGLVLFYAAALPVLRTYLETNPPAMMFASLGLIVSGFALYGHMAVSLTAKLIVDTVTHGGDRDSPFPRLGPAEALERQRDYDGAYNEYLVLARVYPRDPSVKIRLADVCLHLGRKPEAADWFERALQRSPERSAYSLAATRLADLADRELNDTPRARKALKGYLEAFPEATDREPIEMRLAGLGSTITKVKRTDALVSLDELSLEVVKEEEEVAPLAILPGIEAIDSPMEARPAPEVKEEESGGAALGLEKMEDLRPKKK